ncbi:MAG: hypothetical protein J5502_03095 [Prevotella sp.]|nr:hypothetical protein [Prevotella sp.]
MTTKNSLVKTMFVNILTAGIFATVFTACSDDIDALSDSNASSNNQPATRQEILEPLGLNFFDYNTSGDVQILNADTTKIGVSKALAEKLGIRSFVNHPTGVWQSQNQRPFHVRAISEKTEGDRIILDVQKAGIGEFMVGKRVGFDTRLFINENAGLTRGGNGDLSSRYTDEEGFIHPMGVRVIHRDCEPTGLTRGMDSFESEDFSAEELLGMNKTRGILDWIEETFDDIAEAAKKAWRGHYFTVDKKGNVINIETEITADPQFGSNGDTLNVHIKAPASLNLNYKFYLDVDRDYVAVPILNKFDAGIDGRFTFKPQITIGFDKEKKLAEVKKEIWNFTAFTFWFNIGPAVFWVDVNPSMYMKFDAKVKGSFYGGVKYEYDRTFKGGLQYTNDWHAYGETEEVKNKVTFITPTTSFQAEAGIGLFLGVDLIIDKLAGPTIAIGPKLSAEAELKIAPLEDKPINFNAEVKAGVYAELGAKLKVWKFELGEWSTKMKLVPETSLFSYEYPTDQKADDRLTKLLDAASEGIRSARDYGKENLMGIK